METLYTETPSLKITPRDVNEIVRSWIRLLVYNSQNCTQRCRKYWSLGTNVDSSYSCNLKCTCTVSAQNASVPCIACNNLFHLLIIVAMHALFWLKLKVLLFVLINVRLFLINARLFLSNARLFLINSRLFLVMPVCSWLIPVCSWILPVCPWLIPIFQPQKISFICRSRN